MVLKYVTEDAPLGHYENTGRYKEARGRGICIETIPCISRPLAQTLIPQQQVQPRIPHHKNLPRVGTPLIYSPLASLPHSSFIFVAFLYHQNQETLELTRQAMASRPTLHQDSSSEPDCYVCSRMNNRKPTIQVGDSATRRRACYATKISANNTRARKRVFAR